MRAAAAYFLPRALHPGAWWLWALGMAVASSKTTNPLLLGLIATVAVLVVVLRRPYAPWALAFRLYLWVALFIVCLRVFWRVVFSGDGPTVLFTLPRVPLPDFMTGLQILGPVSAESLLTGLAGGLQLGVMVVCVGAANSLANPNRLLAAVPGALYELGTVLVVSLSVFPQLAESVQRVGRARLLRSGETRRRHILRQVMLPVLADALDRSLYLAGAMDSRGYGRRAAVTPGQRRVTSLLLVGATLIICVGVYAVMDSASTPPWLGPPALLLGLAAAVAAFRLAGRRVIRTRYRPDRWRLAELVAIAGGVVPAVGMVYLAAAEPASLYPSVFRLALPPVPFLALPILLAGVLPALLTPSPEPALAEDEDDAGADAAAAPAPARGHRERQLRGPAAPGWDRAPRRTTGQAVPA
ncbi:MAG: energy-coupling factor transporter transmembrane protein EcfT [Propionibacteriaceae bacterium]|jgi:energy-coupling factor transport system permease protein|nr:energy-coupling factor transporter transmembrane protein EcfT [Propionibacteriaceae bacterium]